MTLPDASRPATTRARASPSCCAASATCRRCPTATSATARHHPRHDRASPSATPTAWSWPATAGPPRATSSRHRAMEKVYPGRPPLAASPSPARPGPAMEMVKLFQLQLEHYEKVEGVDAQPRRQGQPALGDGAQQPARPPCRAWSWCRSSPATTCAARQGRLFQYDVTGGRYEESNFAVHRLGQPARRHGDQARLPRRTSAATTPSTSCIAALFQAADEDSATGGPDLVRGIYPTMATITATASSECSTTRGRRAVPAARRAAVDAARARPRRPETDDATRGRPPMSMPFYVAPEQVMKDRADYARKGIARGRGLVALPSTTTASSSAPRTRPTRCARSARSTTASPSPASASTTSSTSCASPASAHADLKGYSFSREDVDARSLANAVRADPRPDLHPRDEADGGRDPRGRGRRRRRPTTSCSTSSTTARSWTRSTSACSAARPRRSRSGSRRRGSDGLSWPSALPIAVAALAGPDRTLAADELEVAVLGARTVAVPSAASKATR